MTQSTLPQAFPTLTPDARRPVSQKTLQLLSGLSISLMMSAVMSFVMLWLNAGFIPGFLFAWAKSWAFGGLIAFPTAAVAGPLTQKLLNAHLRAVDS